MPSLRRENVRRATLLFRAEGVNVRTIGAGEGVNAMSYDVKRIIGKRLSMGKAAFVTVQEYVRTERANLTFARLKAAFPKSVNGKYEVVQNRAEPHSIRVYPQTHGVIVLPDGTEVLVTNQWYKEGEFENWTRFVRNAKRFGIEISVS